jgi:hypothetical protein
MGESKFQWKTFSAGMWLCGICNTEKRMEQFIDWRRWEKGKHKTAPICRECYNKKIWKDRLKIKDACLDFNKCAGAVIKKISWMPISPETKRAFADGIALKREVIIRSSREKPIKDSQKEIENEQQE